MTFGCILVILYTVLPFVRANHPNNVGFNSGINLHWMNRNDAPIGTQNTDSLMSLHPDLGDTIAAVDPTEVKAVSDNTSFHGSSSIDPSRESNHHMFENNVQFHNQPFRLQFENARHIRLVQPQNPFTQWHPSSFHEQQNFQNQPKNIPGHIDQPEVRLSSLGQSSKLGLPNQVHPPKTDNRGQKSIITDSISTKETISHNRPNNLLNGILQTLTNNVVSALVNQLTQGNQKSGTTLGSLANGHDINREFSPVGHTHGPNGEVIPISHGDHVHGSDGKVIPVSNFMPSSFGYHNSWNQNPFFHQSVQGSRRGWVLG